MEKILVDMDGRLGNQMFQYAYALKLKKQFPKSEIIINFHRISLYADLAPNESGWKDNLQYFKADHQTNQQKLSDFLSGYLSKTQYFWLRVTNRLQHHLSIFKKNSYFPFEKLPNLLKYYSRFLYRHGLLIYPSKIEKLNYEMENSSILLHSYFEDASFFEGLQDELRATFSPREELLEQNKDLYKKIKEGQSICITIRRGDYLSKENQQSFFQCDESYFIKGIEIIKEKVKNPIFFFFSDDLEYTGQFAVEVMTEDDQFFVEKEGNPIWEKLRLMSACKHYIISNSTFSWWCQFLSDNPQKIVVGPKNWYPKDSINKNNALVQNDWIQI
ncbi:Glycosyltransferase [Lactococcus lactis subsp. lactis NCDO 2118]|uniref:Glycosyltransferase n=1 Tax=Lactococcus lactis subsp. lactis NCDO 2118 TaxID=1117941 RepID=A0ABC8A8E7_LACLL|nr:alpha-1,2-fucosyltransferase [Lactococcus lactis]ABX75657.2 Glycosyltransferase, family 11 [Lactococcus lactis subsp. lactis KF147]AII13630.1 Glycosyltransferase [Lactococcus lactis subsp. lactis NCDO 2118]